MRTCLNQLTTSGVTCFISQANGGNSLQPKLTQLKSMPAMCVRACVRVCVCERERERREERERDERERERRERRERELNDLYILTSCPYE